jgi:hypothetical protein
MTVCIELPAELEMNLRREVDNLDQKAKESLLLELYRTKKITHHELGLALNLDRFAVDSLLNAHGVT